MKTIFLAIAMTASLYAQTCTRASLTAMAANYFKAVEKHSMAALPTTANVRVTENAVGIKPGEGFVKSGGKAQLQRTIVDTGLPPSLAQDA